jgi:divalent metal cation (Fe/Co/Zn/Cd) transporter
MSNKIGYKQQQNLSVAQLLAELPSFVAVLVSAILSRNLLVYIDLLDSTMYLISLVLIVILSRKLTEDLRYEYNYGIGKIEAISSLLCDGMGFFGLLITLGFSVQAIIVPKQPSELVIAVVGLKTINVAFDTAFFVKQRKITRIHNSAISKSNYAEALSALLFDSIALVSLFVMWLLRDYPIGGYIAPVISIFVVIYLMVGYVRRIRQALTELTDKTLPEEDQMKILNILTRYYDSFSQFYSINSHKSGEITSIDIHISFEKNTTFEEILTLKKQMQDEFVSQFGNCSLNIIVEED